MEVSAGQLAREIVSTLRSHGYQGYLVGGCVRDLLLGIPPKDYDVTTDAHPEQVLKLFPDARKLAKLAAHARTRARAGEAASSGCSCSHVPPLERR